MAILSELFTHFLDPPMSVSHHSQKREGTPLFAVELREASGHNGIVILPLALG